WSSSAASSPASPPAGSSDRRTTCVPARRQPPTRRMFMTQDTATAPAARPAATGRPEGAARWWRDAVIYQVYVRSFADSDGDGVGDLPGVRARLPYLASLGVDALWLTPFYVSPMADFGYDEIGRAHV